MGGDAARCLVIDLRNDHLPNTTDIAQHFVVPESEHTKSLATHEIIASRIVCACLGVLTSIHFDHYQCLHAGEVGDVGAEAYLPAEFVAIELA